MKHGTLGFAALILASGCGETPEASEEFSDAIRYLFRTFDGEQAELSAAIEVLEEQIYLSMDMDAQGAIDRALEPEPLTADDYVGVDPNPDRDPEAALPLAVAYASPHELDDHWPLQLEVDHTEWEPHSPDHYEREFLDGEDCWGDCERLETLNTATKTNILLSVEYFFYKDFRFIDLNAHDEAATDERIAVIARSWYNESFAGEAGQNYLHQGSTIELWLPRDGGGFVRDGTEVNMDDGDWDHDSTGGGTLRMLGLWAESELGGLDVDDDTIVATTRAGIDQNFQATDDYLDDLLGR